MAAIVRINLALRNRILDCIFNSGTSVAIFNSATVEFRSGTQPAAADDSATGTVAATISLPADAMAAASSGSCAKSGTWEDISADAGTTITWARFTDGTFVMDVNCGAVGSGATIEIDSPTTVAGQDFKVVTFAVSMPAST